MAETKTQAAEPKKSGWMTKLFGFDPSTMKVSTEIVAGITTFLAMSYILAVTLQSWLTAEWTRTPSSPPRPSPPSSRPS